MSTHENFFKKLFDWKRYCLLLFCSVSPFSSLHVDVSQRQFEFFVWFRERSPLTVPFRTLHLATPVPTHITVIITIVKFAPGVTNVARWFNGRNLTPPSKSKNLQTSFTSLAKSSIQIENDHNFLPDHVIISRMTGPKINDLFYITTETPQIRNMRKHIKI